MFATMPCDGTLGSAENEAPSATSLQWSSNPSAISSGEAIFFSLSPQNYVSYTGLRHCLEKKTTSKNQPMSS